MLRLISGSVLVASVSHAVWNAIDYPLFGFGEHIGKLGIQQTELYGPEVGILGLILNLGFIVVMGWMVWRKRSVRRAKIELTESS